MKTRNFYFTIVLLFFFLGTFSSLYSQYGVLNAGWELGVKAMGSGGFPISVSVKVYTFNTAARNLELYVSGSTIAGQGFPNNDTNGWADIGDNNSVDPMFRLPGGGNYYVKIENGFFIMTFLGGTAYGDMKFVYNNGSLSLDYNSSRYEIDGPYTWSEKTIILANDFGSDKTSSFGNIHLNSVTISNVGLSGTTQTREAGTFPHTIAGEDNQNANYYYRKWRNWNDADPNISRTLSDVRDYDLTAIYAKQVNATISKNYSQGELEINGIEVTDNQYFYDDQEYLVSTGYGRSSGGLLYELDHWVYNGSNNYNLSFFINNPSTSQTISAYYTRRPSNVDLNLHFGSTVGQPLVVLWSDNVNTAVNQYQIWRKVVVNNIWSDPVLLTTVGRGVQAYTDYDYLKANWKQYTALEYDVRQYFSTDGTYSYPIFADVYGQAYSIVQNDETLNSEMFNEVPTTYSIANYPNPFNPTTTINYQLPQDGFVTIKIYDILGKEVTTLVNENKSAGYYEVNFDASKLTSGVYIYTINAGKYTQSKKMLLVK